VPVTDGELLVVHLLAQRAVETALLRSVALATGLHGMPSAAEWRARPDTGANGGAPGRRGSTPSE
jgi:hypothetical protein